MWARWAHPRAAPAAVGGGGGSACPRLPARPRPRLYLPNATHDATLRCATLRFAAARRRLLVFARCCCSALAPAAAAPVELAGKLAPAASPRAAPSPRVASSACASSWCRNPRRPLLRRLPTSLQIASRHTPPGQPPNSDFGLHGSSDCSRGSIVESSVSVRRPLCSRSVSLQRLASVCRRRKPRCTRTHGDAHSQATLRHCR